jgi:hypothetical protein
MKRLVLLFLLILFILPGCEKKKPEIEIPMPTEPPNPAEMQPAGPPS